MNRIADLGMLIGIFLIYWTFCSVSYDVVFANVASVDVAILTVIGIFLFIGAMGKSAQFPLHTWLADAMEGPTPVSALIHAATMVTAGVYLVIRSNPLYTLIPEVGYMIACIGAFVAIFAASMALVNRDLKRIIAYSTLSQLGYMFVAAGLGYYWVALFHLMTHAFFKALLFLGAGNVMHAMHDELDIKKMGGLFKVMKPTAIMMTIASVALAGIYPFAGFFSKDKILEVAFGSGHEFLWATLLITAALTAFYSFRLIMLVFFGEEKYKNFFPNLHPHEAYTYMLVAMSPLFILSFVSGFFEHGFLDAVRFVLPITEPHMEHSTAYKLIAITSVFALGGIFVAVYAYTKNIISDAVEKMLIYKILFNQYFIPHFYDKFISVPYREASKFMWANLDVRVVDFIVDFIATRFYRAGEESSNAQNGNLSTMLRMMFFGLLILMVLIAVL
jgi:NADH-quinone oxidoreductase subunit L